MWSPNNRWARHALNCGEASGTPPRRPGNANGATPVNCRVYNVGYGRQAAYYLEGAAVHWPDTFDLFMFVVVENEPPHAVAVYELDARALELARAELRTLRTRYRVCIETGEWPGYGTDVMRIGLPAWPRLA